MSLSPEVLGVQNLPRPIAATATNYGPGDEIDWHSHPRAQLIYGISGVLTVITEAGRWVLPPERAVWVPGGIKHRSDISGEVRMRSLFVAAEAAKALPRDCCVVTVSPLLRELILEAVSVPKLYDIKSPDGRLMAVILDRLQRLEPTPLYLPIPADARLRRITDTLAVNPGKRAGLEAWAKVAGASARTLARLFVKETGLTFGAWRQQARLLKALEWLAEGRPVTAIAFDLGYESPSAFIAMFRRTFGVPPGRYLKGQ
ncbi:MAG: helix-turn-helix transcriptional regulator [Rhodospirillales bacterium]|nr:helix-turn-helix transcriptional regulator [Alphaproteobacteria bacterium]MBL6947505.1 helix-turn-helix transcriptional regulator [Rhodospirillales bacterium]